MMKEKLPVRGTSPDAEVSPFVIFHTHGSFYREGLHEKVEEMENQGRIIVFSGKTEGLSAEEAGWNSSFSMQTRHFHSELELYFLMEGERYYFVDQNTYHLVPHTGILIGRNRIHKTSVCPENPAHRRFLLEYSQNPYDMLLKGLHYPGFEGFGSEFSGPVCFRQDEWERVCLLITELKEKMTAGNLCNREIRFTQKPLRPPHADKGQIFHNRKACNLLEHIGHPGSADIKSR